MRQLKYKTSSVRKKELHISRKENNSNRSRLAAKAAHKSNVLSVAIKPPKRLGTAKGKFTIPDDFDRWDEEIADLFEGLA